MIAGFRHCVVAWYWWAESVCFGITRRSTSARPVFALSEAQEAAAAYVAPILAAVEVAIGGGAPPNIEPECSQLAGSMVYPVLPQ